MPGSRLVVDNPATGEPILELNQASVAQVDDAVKAARSAFDSGLWADGVQRRDVLLRLADLLERHQAEFSAAIIAEVGTPQNLIAPLQLGGTAGSASILCRNGDPRPHTRSRV